MVQEMRDGDVRTHLEISTSNTLLEAHLLHLPLIHMRALIVHHRRGRRKGQHITNLHRSGVEAMAGWVHLSRSKKDSTHPLSVHQLQLETEIARRAMDEAENDVVDQIRRTWLLQQDMSPRSGRTVAPLYTLPRMGTTLLTDNTHLDDP